MYGCVDRCVMSRSGMFVIDVNPVATTAIATSAAAQATDMCFT